MVTLQSAKCLILASVQLIGNLSKDIYFDLILAREREISSIHLLLLNLSICLQQSSVTVVREEEGMWEKLLDNLGVFNFYGFN
ncbi:hypothetical protein GLYMA_14G019300v4 [Glycine max]|uniref:Uncharacterized protein n=1 Tax=Glycine max TaxID=3847 RepID=A0A0R0G8L0_SOYBN|nr:hypothetical protein GYH30_038766 [Glycine max]KRH14327.1 hypothetical protein GLYMA_14G019300v4 [Glycine max]